MYTYQRYSSYYFEMARVRAENKPFFVDPEVPKEA